MIDIKFEKYQYYPTLRTRPSEMRGLEKLDDERKSKIVPLLTLGRWPRASDFDRSAERASEIMNGHPYFLDLTDDPAHLAEQQKILRDPFSSFKAWREFLTKYESAIPVVQLNSDAKVRDIFKQAQAFERAKGKIAFRIKDFISDTQLVINALSALDDTSNAIVFIDCQYIRDSLMAYVTAVVATINQLRNEFPELMIVVMSTSFPSSVISFADNTQTKGIVDILERQLHARIGGNPVATYGDHASIHSVVYDDVAMRRWAARIDYPQDFQWAFVRRPRDQSSDGYISSAKEIVQLYPEIGLSGQVWGEQMILDAARGSPFGIAPSSWIAVRVNIHLTKQVDLSALLESQDDVEDDDD